MAKLDWNITGTGGQAVINETGSMRLQLTYRKQMLWNGRSDLANSEVICLIKQSASNAYARGGMLLRSDVNGLNCYRCWLTSARLTYIQKVVGGVVTNLASVQSSQIWNQYVQTRFRVDGWQLSVEEYITGAWQLLTTVEDNEHSHAQGYAGLFGDSLNVSYYMLFDDVEIGEVV